MTTAADAERIGRIGRMFRDGGLHFKLLFGVTRKNGGSKKGDLFQDGRCL
jgi:hypothetical protein